MEYRLNKIDTDIRQRINDETKDGVIHRKTEVKINRDEANKEKNHEHPQKEKREKFSIEKYVKKTGKIVVQAEKVEEINVNAEKESKGSCDYKGQFIDIRK